MSRVTMAPALAGGNTRNPQAGSRQLGDTMYSREKYPDVEAVVARMAALVQAYRSHPQVRNLAVTITRRVSDMRQPQPIAEAVHRWIRQHIRYVLDPEGVELLQSPDRVLRVGYADCDGMSVLAASLLSAVGVRSGFEIIAQRTPVEYDHVYVVYRRLGGSTGTLDATRSAQPGPNPNPTILSRKTFWIADMHKTGSSIDGALQLRGLGQAKDEASVTTTGGGSSTERVLVETINTLPDLVRAFRLPPEQYERMFNQSMQQSGGTLPPSYGGSQQATILGMTPQNLLLTGGALVGGLWALNKFVLD